MVGRTAQLGTMREPLCLAVTISFKSIAERYHRGDQFVDPRRNERSQVAFGDAWFAS